MLNGFFRAITRWRRGLGSRSSSPRVLVLQGDEARGAIWPHVQWILVGLT